MNIFKVFFNRHPLVENKNPADEFDTLVTLQRDIVVVAESMQAVIEAFATSEATITSISQYIDCPETVVIVNNKGEIEV